MAKKKSTRDVGFEQAAAAAVQPFVPPTSDLTATEIRDFGFEQAAERSGKPFVRPAVTQIDSDEDLDCEEEDLDGEEEDLDGEEEEEEEEDGDTLTPYERFLKNQEEIKRRDAFQAIATALQNWGIEGLTDTVFALMSDPSIGEEQALYKLKLDTSINPVTNKPWNEAYAKRFSANFERIKDGKSALSENEYLTAERSYARALQGLGVSRLATRANFNKFISGDVSTDEVVDRVNTAVSGIENAPKETREAFSRFFPSLSILDIVEAVLDPEISLPALKRQIATAEIAGAGARAGLGVTRQRAEDLVQAKVTEEQADVGFQQIAGGMERGGQLAAIYREQPYGQETAEQEIFNLAGAPEARKRRQKIIKSEQATFGGQTGLTGGALSRDRAGQY